MKTFFFVVTISIFNFAPSALPGESQVPRIGMLARYREKSPVRTGFVEGLKDLGYREGENILLHVPRAKTYDDLSKIAAGYVMKRFKVIVPIGSKEAGIAKKATDDIPIVCLPCRDPVRAGFVKSLAFPGTNLTGLTHVNVEFTGKQLQLFKETVPTLERLTVLYDDSNQGLSSPPSLAFMRKAAGKLGLTLMEKPVRSIGQAIETVSSLSTRETDGIFLVSTNLFAIIKEIPLLAKKKSLPLFGGPTLTQKFGALMAYAPDLKRIGHRGAWYVHEIVKGTHPRDLPVENPTHFKLILNLETAHGIGLNIPRQVLIRADQVIR